MSISEDKRNQIVRRAEAEARKGNKQAMNMLHLYDLAREMGGRRYESLDIPPEGGVRYVPRAEAEPKSYASSSASW